jgi:hypothetical protein
MLMLAPSEKGRWHVSTRQVNQGLTRAMRKWERPRTSAQPSRFSCRGLPARRLPERRRANLPEGAGRPVWACPSFVRIGTHVRFQHHAVAVAFAGVSPAAAEPPALRACSSSMLGTSFCTKPAMMPSNATNCGRRSVHAAVMDLQSRHQSCPEQQHDSPAGDSADDQAQHAVQHVASLRPVTRIPAMRDRLGVDYLLRSLSAFACCSRSCFLLASWWPITQPAPAPSKA